MKTVVLAVPQLTGGGAERVVSVWANELSKKNVWVNILCFYRTKNEYDIGSKVEVDAVASSVDEYVQMSFIKRIQVIRKYLKRKRPEYILSFLPSMQVWMSLGTSGLKIKRVETIRINPWRCV